MIAQEVVVGNRHGLHLRAASSLARCMDGFASRATLSCGTQQADARSVLSLLMLGLCHGTRALLTVSGDDEGAAFRALVELFGRNFGEE